MEKQVDFSKIAARPLLPALDASNNLVYVPSYAWWYLDSDGSIVLDLRKRNEWARRTGYVIVVEPFVHCDEKDCYRDFLDCDKFVLYRLSADGSSLPFMFTDSGSPPSASRRSPRARSPQ
jgi:hypothetical protein